MRFLDVIISPVPAGDSATVVFFIGLATVLLICGGTAALLALHFRRYQKREEKPNPTDDPSQP